MRWTQLSLGKKVLRKSQMKSLVDMGADIDVLLELWALGLALVFATADTGAVLARVVCVCSLALELYVDVYIDVEEVLALDLLAALEDREAKEPPNRGLSATGAAVIGVLLLLLFLLMALPVFTLTAAVLTALGLALGLGLVLVTTLALIPALALVLLLLVEEAEELELGLELRPRLNKTRGWG